MKRSDGALLFVSTPEGKTHIVNDDSAEKLGKVETVNTQYGAKVMQLDRETHKLFCRRRISILLQLRQRNNLIRRQERS